MIREKISSVSDRAETEVARCAAKATIRYAKAKKVTRFMFAACVAMCLTATTVAAIDTGDTVGQMVEKIKEVVKIIAGVVILFGAINTGLGIANQDDAGRNRGLMTMGGGAVVELVSGLSLDG